VVAELALRFGLLHPAAVVPWADGIIVSMDEPPMWAIDLSLAGAEEVRDLLRRISSSMADSSHVNVFQSLVRQHWQYGHLSIEDTHAIGRYLSYEFIDEESGDEPHWGFVVSVEFEEYKERVISEKNLRESITKLLSTYTRYDAIIPDWMRCYTNSDLHRLYRQQFASVKRTLLYEWDPIGAGEEPAAQDEYDSYVPVIVRMLTNGSDDNAIAEHLTSIETKQMALVSGAGMMERNRKLAARLYEAIDPFRMRWR